MDPYLKHLIKDSYLFMKRKYKLETQENFFNSVKSPMKNSRYKTKYFPSSIRNQRRVNMLITLIHLSTRGSSQNR